MLPFCNRLTLIELIFASNFCNVFELIFGWRHYHSFGSYSTKQFASNISNFSHKGTDIWRLYQMLCCAVFANCFGSYLTKQIFVASLPTALALIQTTIFCFLYWKFWTRMATLLDSWRVFFFRLFIIFRVTKFVIFTL